MTLLGGDYVNRHSSSSSGILQLDTESQSPLQQMSWVHHTFQDSKSTLQLSSLWEPNRPRGTGCRHTVHSHCTASVQSPVLPGEDRCGLQPSRHGEQEQSRAAVLCMNLEFLYEILKSHAWQSPWDQSDPVYPSPPW